ncbi:MAG: hypothetical protein JO316_25620 [Abitibacteriaceae bacterium]|nr:hypothetical protein [Abditibacteriaceae bacterium]MBV9868751.1 hypothetical protein [Abditibacteriaceae bacterium]
MPRDADLYEEAGGNALEGYFLVKAGKKNIPPSWFERMQESRRQRHEAVAHALQAGDWGAMPVLRDWQEAYQKECFYYGVRVLLELDRQGKSNW